MAEKMLMRVKTDPNMYIHKDGALRVFNVYMWSIPVLSLVVLQRGMEKNFGKKAARDLLYLVGETQSYNATKWTVEKVGIPLKGNELRILQETVSHGEIAGMGVTKILRFDLKRRIVTAVVKNNVYAQQYEKIYGPDCADHYQRGLFAGVVKYLMGNDIVVVCNCKDKDIIFEGMPKDRLGKDPALQKYVPAADLDISFLADLSFRRLLL